MAENPKDSFSSALTLFGSLYQDMAPADLPEGLSPDNQDMWMLPGSVQTRPALNKLLNAPFANTPTIMSVAEFPAATGDFWMMSLDSLGIQRWNGVSGAITSGNVLPGVQCKAESYGNKQWFAYFSAALATPFSLDPFVGVDVPRYIDGTTGTVYRVTTDAPGAPPTLADLNPTVAVTTCNAVSGSTIAVSPNGATEFGNLVTIETTAPHGLHVGDPVFVTGVGVAGYNSVLGSPWTVASVPSPTTFTYNITATGLAGSGGGTANSLVTTVITATAHGLNVGDAFTLSGDSGSNYSNAPVNPVNPPFWIVTSVISATSFTFTAVDNPGSNGGTITVGGMVSAGPRNCVVIFDVNGCLTAPSIPVQFVSAGLRQIKASNVPLGPPGTKRRILAFTQAYGSTYFYITPAKVPGIGGLPTVLSIGTIINDNTTTTLTMDFSDAQLAAGTNISAPGNNLFNQIVLAPCLGVIEYQQRLFWWGEINNIKNLIGCGFESGYFAPLASAIPQGWSNAGSTGGTAGLQAGITGQGFSYYMQGVVGTNDCMISQAAYQDYYGGPILQPNTLYMLRMATFTSHGATIGTFVCDFFSPTSGVLATVSFNPSTWAAVGYGWVVGTFSAPTPATIPADTIIRLYLKNSSYFVAIDELEFINANQPVLNAQLRASYFQNPFGYDQITGVVGLDTADSITACFKQRDYLYPLTSKARWITQNNGTSEPNGWTISEQETECGCCGPCAVDVTEGVAFWAGRYGRRVFTGGAQSKMISLEVKTYWDQVNWAAGLTAWVCVDPVERIVHYGVPLGSAALTPTADLPVSYRAVDSVYNVPDPIRQSFRGNMIALELSRKSTYWGVKLNCAAMITRPLPTGDGNAPLFVCGGGNGLAPGAGAGFGNLYYLNLTKFTDDDYGIIGGGTGNYYTTFAWWSHEIEQAMQNLGLNRKIYTYCALYVTGVGLVTITPYVDDLSHPWAPVGSTFDPVKGYFVPNVTPNPLPSYQLSPTLDHDLEWALNVTGQRVFFKIQVTPLQGQTDAAIKLQHMIVSGRMENVFPVRGAVL